MTDRAGSGVAPEAVVATAPAAALAALTLIWGYNWVVMKVALADSPPLTFAALRSGLSAAALFVVLLVMRKSLAPSGGRGRGLFFLGLFQTAGFVGMVSLSLAEGAAGKSAVLAYTMPFWTLLMASIMLDERVRCNVQTFAPIGTARSLRFLPSRTIRKPCPVSTSSS
jgi:drug/metabolite transporter (DMT)-like permease